MDITDPVSRLVPPRPVTPRSTPLIALVLVSGALASLITFLFVAWSWYPSILSYGRTIQIPGPTGADVYRFGFFDLEYRTGLPGFTGLPFTVVEAVPFGAQGDYAVLAQVPHQDGTVLGVVHADETFTPLVMDGSAKYSLAVRPDGLAVYAAAQGAPVDASSTPPAPPTKMMLDQVFRSARQIPLRIELVDLARGTKPVDMGVGISPRLNTFGQFVVITPRGLEAIDPVTQSTSVLLPLSSDVPGGAISPDGAYALMRSGGNGMTLYHITAIDPATVEVVGRTNLIPPFVLYMPNANEVYARTPQGTIQVYTTAFWGDDYYQYQGRVRLPGIYRGL